MREMYKLYLDQMFRVEVAEALSNEGYDVVRASETGYARADDQQILQKAISENRILITLDEHFGDWVILPLSRHPGVIRIKVRPTPTENILRILLSLLRENKSGHVKDHLVILSETHVKWILTTI